jgi:hypothetical protein
MSYSLSPWLKPRFFITGTNRPLAGGLMYTYKAGTTENATTYSDDAGTPNTNPIVLNSDGECDLYLDDSVSYRIILKNALGVPQFDKDRIASLGSTQVQSFNSIAALRLRSGTTIANAAKTLGYYSAGDGGGNSFCWDSTSVATDNGGTVIKPTSVSGAGRWLAVDAYTINVRQFGAKGDGVADDTAEIQSAITASNTVYFPNGTYLFSGITINTHNVTLYGAGESRSVLLMTNAAAAAVTIASTAFTSGINIRNLKIEGNASNLGGISLGTTTFAAARIRIQDVFITGFQNAVNGYGIRLNSNQNTDIENLWIQECHFGIYRANGGYSTSTRFSGKGSYFGRNCLHGIYVDGQCDDLYIQDGLVEGCLGVGIAVTANAAYITGAGRGTRLILDSVYFEENNKNGLSSYNAVQVIGTATGYAQHTLTMNGCQFAANPSAPGGTKDIGIDKVYAYFNDCRLMPGNVVPTANCNVRFVSCKFPNAENYLTTLKAMPGNVSAFEFADAATSSNPNQMNFVNALTFPATARPVSDPNTLDDYEEGTWTPELSSDGTPPTIAYTEQLGTYTKIGNLVFLKAKIRGVLSVAGTGTPRITGLPAFPLVTGEGLDPVAVSYKQLLTGAPTSAHTLTGPLIELAGTAYQTGAGNNFLVVSVTYRTTA